MTSEERKRILLDIADALEGNSHIIHVENEADVCEAEHAGYEKSLISRLALNPGKVSEISLAMLARANCVQRPRQVMCLCFSKMMSAPNFVFDFAYYAWQITRLANNIRLLANMEDPIGCLSRKTQVRHGL